MTGEETQLRRLPSVHQVIADLGPTDVSHDALLEAVRAAIQQAREDVKRGSPASDRATIASMARDLLERAAAPPLKSVVNASGVILQTNLGRAPLAERAIAAMTAAARGYTNLEYDLDSGRRGSRHDHVRELLRRATGADDGIVLNNNAAALLMSLQVFASGREVVVSRGQAVEIGGGVRIPDILRQSGATLVEVGTTNRTYPEDYAAAIGPLTAMLLRVHTSNFRVIGFTAEASLAQMAAVAAESGALLADDLGSGCLIDTTRYGLAHEPTVQESIKAGADLVMFSGDKLIGGPQCGIVVGRQEAIERLRRHPLARVLRVDKVTIAALCATLHIYLSGEPEREIPIWKMVSMPEDAIRRRAKRWAGVAAGKASVVPALTMVGGGALPGVGVATWCAAFRPEKGPQLAATALRRGLHPVVARIEDDCLMLDPRTVEPTQDVLVMEALRLAL